MRITSVILGLFLCSTAFAGEPKKEEGYVPPSTEVTHPVYHKRGEASRNRSTNRGAVSRVFGGEAEVSVNCDGVTIYDEGLSEHGIVNIMDACTRRGAINVDQTNAEVRRDVAMRALDKGVSMYAHDDEIAVNRAADMAAGYGGLGYSDPFGATRGLQSVSAGQNSLWGPVSGPQGNTNVQPDSNRDSKAAAAKKAQLDKEIKDLERARDIARTEANVAQRSVPDPAAAKSASKNDDPNGAKETLRIAKQAHEEAIAKAEAAKKK